MTDRTDAAIILADAGWPLERIAKVLSLKAETLSVNLQRRREWLAWRDEHIRAESLPVPEKPISFLETSVRTSNVLEAVGLKTVADFMAWSAKPKADLLKTPNFGRASYDEVMDIRAGIEREFT